VGAAQTRAQQHLAVFVQQIGRQQIGQSAVEHGDFRGLTTIF
jgi:hypothetical protein